MNRCRQFLCITGLIQRRTLHENNNTDTTKAAGTSKRGDYLKKRKNNRYEVIGDIVIMETFKQEKFIFDREFLPLVLKSTWCRNKSGGYLVSRRNGRIIRLHRLIAKAPDGLVVDHINGDILDNRANNLRITKQSNNSKNLSIKKNNSTGYPGVSLNANKNRYRVRITVDRKEIRIGTFDTFEEAKAARIKAEKYYFGEFAPSEGNLKYL